MACQRIIRSLLAIAALAATLVVLWAPAIGHAAERDRLASAGQLARGSGYDSARDTDAVRILQRRLRRLGDEPGPVDGLYGPLTEGAVKRFQERHGLAVDGIVGRQTKRSLFTGRSSARKSPAPSIGAESASEQPHEQPHARPLPAGTASRDGPVPANGVPPEVVAAIAALAALMLLVILRRQREMRLNFGLTCAALLGVFGAGAVAGALFATQAAPDGNGRDTARSGVLLAGATARKAPPRMSFAADRARRPRTRALAARSAPPAPAPPALTPATSLVTPVTPVAPVSPPASATRAPVRRAPVRRAQPVTYVVRLGDSLSGIARSKLAAASDAHVAAAVRRLSELNLGTRIRSGDPDVLEAGEELRLP